MSGSNSGQASLIPFADRLRYMHAIRLVLAAVVGAAWFAGAGPQSLTPSTAGLITALYLVITTPSLFGARMRRSVGITVFGGALLLDGVYLAVVSYAVGGFGAPLIVLLLVHVVATTLLGSFRTGLKLAFWHSLLISVVYQLQLGGFIDGGPRPDATLAGVLVAGIWLVTLVTAHSGAANERELRRRNYDLHALARLSSEMEQTTDPDEIAKVIVTAVREEFAVDAVVLAAAASLTAEPRVLAAVGAASTSQALAPAGDEVVAEALRVGMTRRVLAPDAGTNPWLASIMPDAKHVVLVPLHAEGRSLGVLVFAYRGGISSRIERRVVEMVEQFVSHGALELQNAWLLARIGALAATDGLTGIANRRTFDVALDREVQRASASGLPLSLLLIDIDHFKRHNDEYGHQVGDRTLCAVAQALAGHARQTDVAARYGGEEFAVILPGADVAAAVDKAESLRGLVAMLPDPGVTISIGVASYDVHGTAAAELIKAADGALYAAKHNGRDQVSVAGVERAELLREVS